MRSIEQILYDNGPGIGLPLDNTPAGDSANLTGRAMPEGVEPLWERDLAPLGKGDWTLDGIIDCE